MKPMSVAYHGIEKSEMKAGRPAFIADSGTIGIPSLLLAKACGASPIALAMCYSPDLTLPKRSLLL